MSCRSSLGLAASTSASSGPGCEPSRFASANPLRSSGFASIGLESRFMTMYVPSQASLFDDLMSAPLTSSLAAHLVSRSAWPASKKARKTSATSGLISHASSKRSDPVGYWLRTYLAFELSRLTSSSKTWKNSGTPHGRSWWVLQTLEPHTDEKEYGLWASPQARDWKDSGPTQGNRRSPNLGTQVHTVGLLDQENRSANGKRRGSLNPAWVTQLMGFPDGWLDTPQPIAAKPSTRSGTRSCRK